jgi:acetyltransferase-like isoleucine patch superfamily enzyme
LKRDLFLKDDWFPRPLPENVSIGPRSWFYSSFAFVNYRSESTNGVRIGSDTGIYYSSFFDLGPDGEVNIGNFCTIVGAIISTNARIEIGDYSFIGHKVVLADTFACVPRAHRISKKRESSVRTLISLGENCWIGAHATLLAGAHIGTNSVVGAGSVVDFEVPANSIAAGNPARIVGTIPP